MARIEQELFQLQQEYSVNHPSNQSLSKGGTLQVKESFIGGVDVIKEEDEFMEEELLRINLNQVSESENEISHSVSLRQDNDSTVRLAH